MNGTGWGGKAQEEDQIGIEEYSASGTPAGGESHESHASADGYPADACSAHSRRRTGRGEAGFRDFFRGGQSDSQEDADREYSEPVQVAFDAGVECAEEQEKGVNRTILSGGFGRSEVWGAFFCVFAQHIRKRKKQIPRTARRVLRFAEEKAKARDASLGMTGCCLGANRGGDGSTVSVESSARVTSVFVGRLKAEA